VRPSVRMVAGKLTSAPVQRRSPGPAPPMARWRARREVDAEIVQQADEITDQPTATVDAETPYSSTRFQPMNQATNRPIVA